MMYDQTDEIPCLSVLNPWAWAIAVGAKRIETRSWKTDYRGPLLIHAGLLDRYIKPPNPRRSHSNDYYAVGVPAARAAGLIGENSSYIPPGLCPLGAIIAVAELVDCVPTPRIMQDFHGMMLWDKGFPESAIINAPLPLLADVDYQRELALGDYTPGRYGWVLRNVRAIEPIPYRGRQGLFRVPASVLGVQDA